MIRIPKFIGNSFSKQGLTATKNAVQSKVYGESRQATHNARIESAQKSIDEKAQKIKANELKRLLVNAGAPAKTADALIAAINNGTKVSFSDLNMHFDATHKMFNRLAAIGNKDSAASRLGVRSGDVYSAIISNYKNGSSLRDGRVDAKGMLKQAVKFTSEKDPQVGAILRKLGQAMMTQTQVSKGNEVSAMSVKLYEKDDVSHKSQEMFARKNDVSLMFAQAKTELTLGLTAAKQRTSLGLSKTQLAVRKSTRASNRGMASAVGYSAAALRPVGMSAGLVGGAGVGLTGIALLGGVVGAAAGVSPVVAASNVVTDGLTGGPGLVSRFGDLRQGNVKQAFNPLSRTSRGKTSSQAAAGKAKAAQEDEFVTAPLAPVELIAESELVNTPVA